MKTLFPLLTICFLLLCSSFQTVYGQFTPSVQQAGYGLEYDCALPAESYGEMKFIETFENEDYVCTVARYRKTNFFINVILVQTYDKASGLTEARAIELGPAGNLEGSPVPFFAATLSHSGNSVILATDDQAGGPAQDILGMEISIFPIAVVRSRNYRYPAGKLDIITGLAIEKNKQQGTFFSNGYTIIASGRNAANQTVLGALQISDFLFLLANPLIRHPVDYISDADAHEHKMIVVGETESNNRIHVIRYNSSTSEFERTRHFTPLLGNAVNKPRIKFNLSANAREGYFIIYNEEYGAGSSMPVILRARNDGVVLWNKRLGVELDHYGVTANNTAVYALTNSDVNPISGQNEYRRYAFDKNTGLRDPANSISCAIDSRFAIQNFQLGYGDRPLITGVDEYVPYRWTVHKENIGLTFPIVIPPGFDCPGVQSYPNFNRSVTMTNDAINDPTFPMVTSQMLTFENLQAPTWASDCSATLPSDETPTGEGKRNLSEYLDHTAQPIEIYPNPLENERNSFSIRISGTNSGIYRTRLFNKMGQLVLEQVQTLENNAQEIHVNASMLPVGLYSVQVSKDQQRFAVGKLVKL